MSENPRQGIRTRPVDHRARLALLVLTVFAWGTTSGCVTSLGYVQENLKVGQISETSDTKDELRPTYADVKKWAYDVHDGLNSRATANRYAVKYGALFGVAAAGALAGLAIFDSGSAAIKGIPIGATFLAGASAVYQSDFKADLYDRASTYVKKLITLSDERLQILSPKNLHVEAICLKKTVDDVMAKVTRHITLMEPQNVVAVLSTVKGTGDQEKINELVKAARGDLSDLDWDDRQVRRDYCRGTGRTLPGQPAIALDNKGNGLADAQDAVAGVAKKVAVLHSAIRNASVDAIKADVAKITEAAKKADAEQKLKALEGALGQADATRRNVDQEIVETSKLTAALHQAEKLEDILAGSARLLTQQERLRKLSSEIEEKADLVTKATTQALEAVK